MDGVFSNSENLINLPRISNRLTMKKLLLLAFIIPVFYSFSQDKHALIVAIGDYPQKTGTTDDWSDLSSINDYDLVKDFLSQQGFKDDNVLSLLDAKATAENLRQTFETLLNNLNTGDIVYFHFSGHGQQVGDLDGGGRKLLEKDEEDGFDEALVMYDAPKKYVDGYNYENHFVDDEMRFYTSEIRKKLGAKGQLIVVLDACHSGTATRGSDVMVIRGTDVVCAPNNYNKATNANDASIGFDADVDATEDQKLSNMVAFFGCKAEQVNREIKDKKNKGYGSLTYYLINSVYDLKDQASYQNLFSKVNEKMIIAFRNDQNPVIEGDNLNTLIFNGSMVIQKPFFELGSLLGNTVQLDGGQLRGLQIGDSIGLFSNTTADITNSKPMSSGVISEIDPLNATVIFDKAIGSDLEKVKYRAFLLSPVNLSNLIKLKLNTSIKSVKKDFVSYFGKQDNVQISEDNFDYLIVDTLINNEPHARIYIGNNQVNALRGMPWKATSIAGIKDTFMLYLRQSNRTDILRKLDFTNEDATIEVNVYPCLSGCNSKSGVFDTIPISGNFQALENQYFKIKLKNTSTGKLYVNIIDIYPTNQVDWIDGKSANIPLIPGEEFNLFNKPLPPYGLEQFKIITTDQPLDLSQIEEFGSSLSTRGGDNHPLLDYVNEQLNGTRGVSMSSEVKASAINMFFEIKK